MLKKLVKYGNSNALVLDKAILELLNIEEGSVVKITTDGRSITLTPQHVLTSEKISETYTADQARVEMAAQQAVKYMGSEEAAKGALDLYQRFKELMVQLVENENYIKEAAKLRAELSDTASLEFIEASESLRSKYSPELKEVEDKLRSLQKTSKSTMDMLQGPQFKNMQQDFAVVFKKYPEVQEKYNQLLNNPDYQHEEQLIAEKYRITKDSTAYMKALEELQNRYSPETIEFRKELKAVSQKYNNM